MTVPCTRVTVLYTGLLAATFSACQADLEDLTGEVTGATFPASSGGDQSPTSTAEPTGSSGGTEPASTTVTVAGCGDGIVEAGEGCDDGNAIQGDGCNPDCTPSGTLLWEYRADLLPSSLFRGLVALADGSIVAGGGQGKYRLLVRFAADGTILWSRTYEEAKIAEFLGVAASDSRLFGAGTNLSVSDELWVGSFDHEGEPLWSDIVASPFGPAYATDIALMPDGGIVVTGLSTLEGGNAQVWTRRYGADGAVQWTEGRAINDKALFPQGPGISASADRVVVGFYSKPGIVELLLAYPPTGGPPALDLALNSGGPIYATAQAKDGDLLVAGWAKSMGSTVRRVTSDGAPIWSVIDPMGNTAQALAVDSQGDIVMVGDALGPDNLDIAIYKFSAEGELRWRRTIDDGLGHDFGYAVAILPNDQIAAAGQLYRNAQGGVDAWIGVYSP